MKKGRTHDEHFEDQVKRGQTQFEKGFQMSLIELKEEIFGIREEVVRSKGQSHHELEKVRQEVQSLSLDLSGSLNYLSRSSGDWQSRTRTTTARRCRRA